MKVAELQWEVSETLMHHDLFQASTYEWLVPKHLYVMSIHLLLKGQLTV